MVEATTARVRRDNNVEKNVPVETDEVANSVGLDVNRKPGDDSSPNDFMIDGPDAGRS